jgi:hypothetical protein
VNAHTAHENPHWEHTTHASPRRSKPGPPDDAQPGPIQVTRHSLDVPSVGAVRLGSRLKPRSTAYFGDRDRRFRDRDRTFRPMMTAHFGA